MARVRHFIRQLISLIVAGRVRVRAGVTTLRSLPLWFRLALIACLWSLFALGPATRVSYWLTVGTIVEAWPWQFWGEPYIEFTNEMLSEGLRRTYAFVLIGAAGALGLLLRSIARPGPVWVRTAAALPALVSGVLLAGSLAALTPQLLVNSVRLARTFPPRTDAVLVENCGHCHSPYRPQHYVRSKEMWARTVHRMVERNGAPVPPEDAAKIIDWLGDYRAFSDGWMFRAKCERCHHRTHLTETARTAEEWHWIITRVGWLNPFAFREDQVAQLRRYTAQHLADPDPPGGSPAAEGLATRLELQRSCNPCHGLSLILEEGALDDTRAMVERMSAKNPTLVPPDRIDPLTRAVDALPRDAVELGRMFPHDVLLEQSR